MSAAHDLDVLAMELVEAADRPARVLAITGRLAVLARHLRKMEDVAVPPHLWLVRWGLPDGGASLCERRGV